MSKKASLKDAFVRGPQTTGYTAIQPTGYADIQPAPPTKKKATFNLDADLHQRLKVAAAMNRREMVDIVEEALVAYLSRLDPKPAEPAE
jgi:hypothetical protein